MPGTPHRVPDGPLAGSTPATGPAAGPAAETVARLDRTASATRFAVAGTAASGAGWLALDRLRSTPTLDAWYRAELAGPARGHRDVAGSLVAYRVAEALADLVVGSLVLWRRAVRTSPAQVALGLDLPPDGRPRVTAVGITSAVAAVLPDDADAGRPGTVTVPDTATLLATAAGTVVALFQPVTRAVRACAPYGLRGMWGTLADHLAEAALRHAGAAPGDQEAAWATAEALTDRVAARQPMLRGRPRPEWATGDADTRTGLFVAKGTCCLVYKALGRSSGAGRRGPRALIDAGACDTCPLRTRDDRRTRLTAHLDRSRAPTPA